MLEGKITINEQEKDGNYIFAGISQYMTCGFQDMFGSEAGTAAFTALALILEKYPDNTDYLQTFRYCHGNGKEAAFWCINDVDHITFLLPEEY